MSQKGILLASRCNFEIPDFFRSEGKVEKRFVQPELLFRGNEGFDAGHCDWLRNIREIITSVFMNKDLCFETYGKIIRGRKNYSSFSPVSVNVCAGFIKLFPTARYFWRYPRPSANNWRGLPKGICRTKPYRSIRGPKG